MTLQWNRLWQDGSDNGSHRRFYGKIRKIIPKVSLLHLAGRFKSDCSMHMVHGSFSSDKSQLNLDMQKGSVVPMLTARTHTNVYVCTFV